VANTGNAQNVTDVTQLGAQESDFEDYDREPFFNDGFDRIDGDAGDFAFEEVGSSIEVSPEATTIGDQQVSQAASASEW
jgi:hypothetical protein